MMVLVISSTLGELGELDELDEPYQQTRWIIIDDDVFVVTVLALDELDELDELGELDAVE